MSDDPPPPDAPSPSGRPGPPGIEEGEGATTERTQVQTDQPEPPSDEIGVTQPLFGTGPGSDEGVEEKVVPSDAAGLAHPLSRHDPAPLAGDAPPSPHEPRTGRTPSWSELMQGRVPRDGEGRPAAAPIGGASATPQSGSDSGEPPDSRDEETIAVVRANEVRPGQILFGRYEVERKLGEGGFGSVWLVRHLELDAPRALKLIVTNYAHDPEIRARFRREARVMAKLAGHPNAVTIYDARMAGELVYIDMEFIPGRTLDQVLRPGQPMPLDWARHMLEQFCDVLQAAHELGIVHRDLKPQNLMLIEGRAPAPDRLKVLDFGIAKFLTAGDQLAEDFRSRTNQRMCTPQYASPEQIGGDGEVDWRSDIYTVGVILYEWLTGHRPFTGKPEQLYAKHLAVAPEPFRKRNPRARVPSEVEKVVLRCLAKSPDDRPQSARELWEEFQHACIAGTKTGRSGAEGVDLALEPLPTPGLSTDPGLTPIPFQETSGGAPFQPTLPCSPLPAGPYVAEPTPAPAPMPLAPVDEDVGRRRRLRRALIGVLLAASVTTLGAMALPRLGGGRTGDDGPAKTAHTQHPGTQSDGPAATPTLTPSTDSVASTREQTPPTAILPAGYVAVGREMVGGFPRYIRHSATGAEFVYIRPDEPFRMGDWTGKEAEALPVHWVKLSPFYVQITEVTYGQMERFFAANPEVPRPSAYNEMQGVLKQQEGDAALEFPAVGVPWELADRYARWVGGRLCTEAEWEYLARWGGNEELFACGGELEDQGKRTRLMEDGDTLPVRVREFQETDRTPQGVIGLGGNAREWCQDVFRPYEEAPDADRPVEDPCPMGGPKDSHVVRGGSFISPAVRTYIRDAEKENEPVGDVGLRVVIPWPGGLLNARTGGPPVAFGGGRPSSGPEGWPMTEVGPSSDACPGSLLASPSPSTEAVLTDVDRCDIHTEPYVGPTRPCQAEEAGEKPRSWAILIGVDAYESVRISPTVGGRADAEALGRWLVEEGAWDRRNIRTLKTTDEQEWPLGVAEPPPVLRPTRRNIERLIEQWIGPRFREGDFLLVYFAGRAAVMPDPGGRPGREVMRPLPIDAQPDRLEQAAWSPGETLHALAAREAGTILCVFDLAPFPADQPPAPGVVRRFLEETAHWPGVAAWVARRNPPTTARPEVPRLSASLLRALGRGSQGRSLTDVLGRLQADRELANAGFSHLGAIHPSLSLVDPELRERRLRHDADEQPVLQRGHSTAVTALAMARDGSLIATGGGQGDSTVRLWDARDRTLLRILRADHRLGVTALAFGPGDRLLASADALGQLHVWDRTANREIPVPPAAARVIADSRIESLGFTPDEGDARLVLRDRAGRRTAWRVAGGRFELVLRPDASGKVEAIEVAREPGGVLWVELFRPARDHPGQVRVYRDADPKRAPEVIEVPEGIARIALAPDGSELAIVTRKAGLIVRDLGQPGAVQARSAPLPGRVSYLAMPAKGWLLIQTENGRDRETFVQRSGALDRPVKLEGVGSSLERACAVAWSHDGTILAIADRLARRVHAWRLKAEGAGLVTETIALEQPEGIIGVAAMVSPARDALIVGDATGLVRIWSLIDGRVEGIDRYAGQVVHLAAATRGDRPPRYLLQIANVPGSTEGTAQVWDLRERQVEALGDLGAGGEAPLRFDHQGLFVPGQDAAILVPTRGPWRRFDLKNRRFDLAFEPPGDGPAGDGVPPALLAASPDGHLLAAAAESGAWLGIWRVDDGKRLLRLPRGGPHQQANRILGLAFNGDGRRLITADDRGTIVPWDVERDEGGAVRLTPGAALPPAPEGSFLRGVAVAPGPGLRIARGVARSVASAEAQTTVELWDWRDGGWRRVGPPVEGLDGVRERLHFTADGKFLVAAGNRRRIVLMAVSAERLRLVNPLDLRHDEEVTGLASWIGAGGQSVLASAARDGTIRLWNLTAPEPLGTLSASEDAVSWVAYLPDGRFDANAEGARQVARLRDGRLTRLEQALVAERSTFGLAESLSLGQVPPPEQDEAALAPAPNLRLSAVPVGMDERRVELELLIDDPESLDEVTLYHNGMPVLSRVEGLSRRQILEPQALAEGANTFYVMGRRAGALDGRSNEVQAYHLAPTPGVTHVVAIGVGAYSGRPLAYATADARAIADFLQSHGVVSEDRAGSRAPVREVLLDEAVTAGTIAAAFDRVRQATKGHPEDRVVVFLAGHTLVDRDRYALLLAGAEPPPGPPGVRGVPGGLAGPSVPASLRLAYSAIHVHLANIEALNRLVIVDACQAGAIFDDRAVLKYRRDFEREALKSRTSYLLAARQDELAGEVDALRHGLLTYAILRGLGDTSLPAVEHLPAAHGDADANGLIDTREIESYVVRWLPTLRAQFPQLVQRGDRPVGAATGPEGEAAPLVRGMGAASGPSFPLVRVPRPDAAQAAAR